MIATPAKINLALQVGAVDGRGYHPVDTLCVFIDAGDRLEWLGPDTAFSLEVTGHYAPSLASVPPAHNLVLKGARQFAETFGGGPGRFRLHKAVPPASGIGGGTANGVGALYLMNRQLAKPLDGPAMIRFARCLGADGPVCMASLVARGNSFRARGVGERVTDGPILPPLSLCLVNPGEAVSTATVFRLFDSHPVPEKLDLPWPPNVTTVSRMGDWMTHSRNDLAPPAMALAPSIGRLVDEMAASPGCVAARMSGSGATVFGLFSSGPAAERRARQFRGRGLWSVGGPIWGGAQQSGAGNG
ncbi:4-(cytidine 5'-diphospho)-2-C-methyl-D-erythritol kinase [Parvularcula sp. LCG005]|uniref:4-(cytidine 5'-diphospho)-2-C-methyl-D-erythritol kinase n=1 Tax=Parvularcula sp. LCG005 TaxID=3078805 RepID=UPI002943B05D|nr:4-(cytidine 5'-diphospho)-2-C-methyl-D-erythritol kinase [Parvularcula sp. LCG005]WOI52104.1 4-(cytidine 5'-diphospho)-2-C-methyl-D-erythritol kinase [Parvularcula sp. LCG005]